MVMTASSIILPTAEQLVVDKERDYRLDIVRCFHPIVALQTIPWSVLGKRECTKWNLRSFFSFGKLQIVTSQQVCAKFIYVPSARHLLTRSATATAAVTMGRTRDG